MFGYRNQLHDLATGEIYMRHRQVIPELGIFTTPDPLGENGGTYGLYSYVSGDPVQWQDFSGLATQQQININFGDKYRALDAARLQASGRTRSNLSRRLWNLRQDWEARLNSFYGKYAHYLDNHATTMGRAHGSAPLSLTQFDDSTVSRGYASRQLAEFVTLNAGSAFVAEIGGQALIQGISRGLSPAKAYLNHLHRVVPKNAGRIVDELVSIPNSELGDLALANSITDTSIGLTFDLINPEKNYSASELLERSLSRFALSYSGTYGINRSLGVNPVTPHSSSPSPFSWKSGVSNATVGTLIDVYNGDTEAFKTGLYFTSGVALSKFSLTRGSADGHLNPIFTQTSPYILGTIGGITNSSILYARERLFNLDASKL